MTEAARTVGKRVNHAALRALTEALASIYWYKEDLERFVRSCVQRPEIVSRLTFADSNVPTVYIGKADSLRSRLDLLTGFARGEAIMHWGGRLLWQLASSDELLVAWRLAQDFGDLECDLIDEFRDVYGRLPYANLRRERLPEQRESSDDQSARQPPASVVSARCVHQGL
jgi:hypothetical protein